MKSSAAFMNPSMAVPGKMRVFAKARPEKKENRAFFVVTGILVSTGVLSAILSIAILVYGYIQYTSR